MKLRRYLKVSNKVAPNIPKSYLSRNSFYQISCRLKHHQTICFSGEVKAQLSFQKTIPLGIHPWITKDPRVPKLCVYGNHCCCAKQRGRGPGLSPSSWGENFIGLKGLGFGGKPMLKHPTFQRNHHQNPRHLCLGEDFLGDRVFGFVSKNPS